MNKYIAVEKKTFLGARHTVLSWGKRFGSVIGRGSIADE